MHRKRENIKVIVFDLDGVLYDSKEANAAFYGHLLQAFGKQPLTPQQLEYGHTHSLEETLRYLFKGEPKEEELHRYIERMDLRPFLRLTRLSPHVHELLAAIKPSIKKAVCTNRKIGVRLSLEVFGLHQAFDLIITAGDVSRPKPHPEPLLKIVEFFSVSPQSVLYVGDSLLDQQAAEAAGVRFVAYRNRQITGTLVIDDLLEVLALLK